MSSFDLKKQVFSRDAFEKTINTTFTELTSSVVLPTSSNLPTVDEFFQYYTDLFYTIPKFGSENSHEYLVLTSQQYIGTISSDQEVIDALIAEVTELRQENLDLQQQIAQSSVATAEEALNKLREING
jgi:hypothetical protein